MTDVMREYASALFELACEEGSTEETGRALRDVQALMTRYPAWLETLSCPAVDAANRERALEEALGGRVPGVVLSFLKLLSRRGRMSQLGRAAEEYDALCRSARNEKEALVKSAVPLTDGQKEALRARLEKRLGGTVRMQCVCDPALIGGLTVTVDGQVLDGSVKKRLSDMKEVVTP